MGEVIISASGAQNGLQVSPQGAIFTDSQPLVQLFAYSGTNPAVVQYQGWATPGAAITGSAWRISVILYNSDNTVSGIAWASGGAGHVAFDKVWSDRGSYTYQ